MKSRRGFQSSQASHVADAMQVYCSIGLLGSGVVVRWSGAPNVQVSEVAKTFDPCTWTKLALVNKTLFFSSGSQALEAQIR